MWPQVELNEVLKQYREEIIVNDNDYYRQITNSKTSGIGIRGSKVGFEIGRKRQFIVNLDKYPNTIIFTRQTLQQDEAIGLAPVEANGCIVTENMPTFSVEGAIPNYIRYFLKSSIFLKQLQSSSALGTSQKSIHEDIFLKYKIPLPAMPDQKKIVLEIDMVNEDINKLENLINEQDKKINNLIYSLMTDCERKDAITFISDICNTKNGSFAIMKTLPGPYPLVITGAGRKSADSYDFNCEAVCIPLVSSTGHGNAAMHRVHYENGKFALSNLLCALTPKIIGQISIKFLFHLFMVKKDEYFVPLMKGTANVSLNPEKIGGVQIPVPKYKRQLEIVSIIDKLEFIQQERTKLRNKLKSLLTSVIEKAFKGEL